MLRPLQQILLSCQLIFLNNKNILLHANISNECLVPKAWLETEWITSSTFDPYSTIKTLQHNICSDEPLKVWNALKSDRIYKVSKNKCIDLGNGMFPDLDENSDIEVQEVIDKMHAG